MGIKDLLENSPPQAFSTSRNDGYPALSSADQYIKEILEELYQPFHQTGKQDQIKALLENSSFMMKARKRTAWEQNKMHASMRGAMLNLLEGEFFSQNKDRTVEIPIFISKEDCRIFGQLLHKTSREIHSIYEFFQNHYTYRAGLFQVNPAVKIQTDIVLCFHEKFRPSVAINLNMLFSEGSMRLPLASRHYEKVEDIRTEFFLESREGIRYLVCIRQDEEKESIINQHFTVEN